MQVLGKSAKYALQAARIILSRPTGEFTQAAAITGQLEGSATYINKVLQELVRNEVLGSKKGVGGGFYLKRPASEISLWDLVSPFEEFDPKSCAIDAGRPCCDDSGCGMHEYWERTRTDIVAKLRSTTLHEFHRLQGRPLL